MSSYPYLTFGEVEVQEEKDGLACDESLDVMRHEFLADIDHLKDTSGTVLRETHFAVLEILNVLFIIPNRLIRFFVVCNAPFEILQRSNRVHILIVWATQFKSHVVFQNLANQDKICPRFNNLLICAYAFKEKDVEIFDFMYASQDHLSSGDS